MSAGLDVEAILRDHEARWTTHGWERLYDVIHCSGECDWSLRQKKAMTDESCYEAHRAHVAAKVREAVAAWLESEAAVETAAVAINRADNEALEATNFGTVVATYRDEAAAALSALTEAVRDA